MRDVLRTLDIAHLDRAMPDRLGLDMGILVVSHDEGNCDNKTPCQNWATAPFIQALDIFLLAAKPVMGRTAKPFPFRG